MTKALSAAEEFSRAVKGSYGTILADPPWRFSNRTGKMAPEHRRLVRGKVRTLAPGRRQVNVVQSRKREHSRKPEELYKVVESCSPAPYLELFARSPRDNWDNWGNELGNSLTAEDQEPPQTDAARQLRLMEDQGRYSTNPSGWPRQLS